MKTRKAQAGMWQVIIYGIIAITVVAVVLLIFGGQMGRIFGKGISPLINTIGEKACAAQAVLGGDVDKCCSDLYEDMKSKKDKIDLKDACVKKARKEETS